MVTQDVAAVDELVEAFRALLKWSSDMVYLLPRFIPPDSGESAKKARELASESQAVLDQATLALVHYEENRRKRSS